MVEDYNASPDTNRVEPDINGVDADAQQMMDAYKDSLILVLLDKLGGEMTIPIDHVDDYPVGRGMSLAVVDDSFVIKITEGPYVKVPST